MARIPFRPKDVTLRPLFPNQGLEAAYRRKLRRLIDDMHRSVCHWLTAAWRKNEPVMARDTPADDLQREMRRLWTRWQQSFDVDSEPLAEFFAKGAKARTDAGLRAALRKAGFSVKFKTTRAQRDILDATIHANVALIKSIPQKYLAQVEGIVMRSVQTGRDLSQLTKDLEEQYGVTRRRAAFIALDQNNKATSALQKARQLELGLEQGIWMHSGGGKHPRPKHVKATGKKFDLAKGLKVGDKGGWVMPGEEPGCRCVWRAVVPGFD